MIQVACRLWVVGVTIISVIGMITLDVSIRGVKAGIGRTTPTSSTIGDGTTKGATPMGVKWYEI